MGFGDGAEELVVVPGLDDLGDLSAASAESFCFFGSGAVGAVEVDVGPAGK